jgi:hypothetical protein
MVLKEYDVTKPEGSLAVAVGDGNTDDTQAFQDRLDLITRSGGGWLYIPGGSYRINKTLHVTFSGPTSIKGDGDNSLLLWNFDGDLFVWDQGSFSHVIRDLVINATLDQRPQSTAFNLTMGATTNFEVSKVHISALASPGNPIKFGSGIKVSTVYAGANTPRECGSLRFTDLELWHYRGTAIRVEDSTDVWIRGCRMPAIDRPQSSVGIHVAGNSGGVLIENCDIIQVDICIYVTKRGIRDARPGNSEVFIVGGACDLSNYGLRVKDSPIIGCTGAWFASCVYRNILVENRTKPRMEITGGIIHNAGPFTGENVHHGAEINGGDLVMSGVLITHNAGVGLKIGSGVKGYIISGCSFIDNFDLGAEFRGSQGVITGNLFRKNKEVVSGGQPVQYMRSTYSGVNILLANNLVVDPR